MKRILKLLFILVIIGGLWGLLKPLPEGVSIEGELHRVTDDSVHFLSDVTYVTDEGVRFSEQEIFDEVFSMIDEAQHYILIDFFLYNDMLGTATTSYRALSQELTDKLVEKKKNNPGVSIVFISDPINEIYGGSQSPDYLALQDAGVNLIVTDLTKLRDSNPVYSAFWRTLFQWFGNSDSGGVAPNPFDANGQKLSIRSYLSLLNFKANHRKVVMADTVVDGAQKLSVLITSANPHDGSAGHTNAAIKVDDFLWRDVLASERAVAHFSDADFIEPTTDFLASISDTTGESYVQLLTEAVIRNKLVELVDSLGSENTLDIAMFYFSDRPLVRALKRADARDVKIRLLLDPNKDAFGREKNGVPNRPVADELLSNSKGNTQVRWCHTHGEQCHTKLLLFSDGETATLVQGSANLTRRNIGDYNLETNVLISSKKDTGVFNEAYAYFEKVWNNETDKVYSIEYDYYKDESVFHYVLYRVMESVGTSSF